MTVTTLPDYVVLDPSIEKLPPERLCALQSERLRATVTYAYERAPFWRRKFDDSRLTPADVKGLEDLPRIPFCTKEELQADQRTHPPYGSYLASDPRALVRFMTTSGTTGQPLRRVFSARDWGYVLDRLQRNSPIGPGDIVMTLGPMDGLMGPTASAEAHARAGALIVLAGLYDSVTKVRLIAELRPTIVSGAASYFFISSTSRAPRASTSRRSGFAPSSRSASPVRQSRPRTSGSRPDGARSCGTAMG